MVTGGSGFIGTHFISELQNKKKFNIYSLSQKKLKKEKQKKNVKYIICKLQNKSELKKKIEFQIGLYCKFSWPYKS